MKEKAALVEKNNQLERDNEALQELVGFLSGEFEGDPDDFGQYGDVGEDGCASRAHSTPHAAHRSEPISHLHRIAKA